MHRIATPFAVLALTLCLGAPALADTIHLSSGGVVRGTIVKESSRSLTVQTLGGLTVVPRDDIERIERGKSTVERYRAKLKKVDKSDPAARLALAKWCEKQPGGKEVALQEYAALLELDPEHTLARQKLDYVRKDGQWIKRGAKPASAAVAQPKTREKKLAAKLEVPASLELNEALAGIRSTSAEKRQAGWVTLKDEPAETERLKAVLAGEPNKLQARLRGRLSKAYPETADLAGAALGEHVQRYVQETLHPAVDESLQSFARTVVRRHARVVKRVAGLFKEYVPGSAGPTLEKRSEALADWNSTRDEALRVIFDLSIYPDANHGRSGQPVVDEKVAACRAKWEPFNGMVEKDLAKILLLSEAEANDHLEAIAIEYSRLDEVNALLSERGAEGVERPEVAPGFKVLLAYRAGKIDWALGAADQLNAYEQELLRRLRDERVRAFNASFKTKNPHAFGIQPMGEEVEQVRLTNDYRIMMARPALEIDPRLVQSARGHSGDMTRLGFFAHESPVAGKRNPSDRMAAAGYPGVGGENISLGSTSPKATHIAWYNSSGHHRNILGPRWTSMGSGKDGQHWTQNFGSNSELKR